MCEDTYLSALCRLYNNCNDESKKEKIGYTADTKTATVTFNRIGFKQDNLRIKDKK